MRYRPIDRDPEDPRLDRLIPDDWAHVEKYPLTALSAEEYPTKSPVVIGVNWYSEFDHPAADEGTGEYFVARGGAGSLTRIRAGDEWPDTQPGDDNETSVRAAGGVLSQAGHVDWSDGYADDDASERAGYQADAGDGITTFRWAQSVDDVHRVLGNPRADELGAVPFLNSWGRGYPHRTWVPDEVLERLMQEQGGVAIPTDR